MGLALWRFHGPQDTAIRDERPKVTMGREFSSWFQTARVVEAQPSHYSLELRMTDRYLASLDTSTRGFDLGYHLIKGGSVLARGEVSCELRRGTPVAQVTIPNVDRVAADEIEIYLAH
jgi:hypothetical protein